MMRDTYKSTTTRGREGESARFGFQPPRSSKTIRPFKFPVSPVTVGCSTLGLRIFCELSDVRKSLDGMGDRGDHLNREVAPDAGARREGSENPLQKEAVDH